MGAWGAGIFANDEATDVRAEWRDALVAGEDPAAASTRIVERWGDAGTDFWTGLALAQHETGHLQDEVRDAALADIAAGGDLELWDEGDVEGRRRALDQLAETLRGPQPKPKKLRGPRPGPHPGVEVGDALRIRSSDGARCAYFAVTGMHEHRGQRWPELLGIHWQGEAEPTAEALKHAPYLADVDLTSFEWEDGLPEHFDGAFPLTITIVVARRSDVFGGEIVAKGIHRVTPGAAGTLGGWASLVADLDAGAYDFYAEATRRRLQEFGDDPCAWIRGQEKRAREYEQQMGPLLDWARGVFED